MALLLATCPLPNGPDWTKDIDDNVVPLIPPINWDPDSYILTYDLQAYIPIPVEGGVPIKTITNRRDMDIRVVWKDANDRVIPEPFNGFVLDKIYKADILLSVKNNYSFDQSISFKYPEGAVTRQPDNNFEIKARSLTTVTYNWVRAPILIDAGTVNPAVFIPAPVAGETPVRFLVTAGYTGTAEYMVGDFTTPMTGNRFEPDTDYNAVVSLYAGPGALFTGTLVTGGTLVDAGTNNGASITGIKLDFPPTGKAAVTDFDLTRYVPTPVTRGTPAAEFTAPQYKGTVTWKPAPAGGSFVMGEPYTAAVTLTGVSGYTLAGVGANAFTHNATVLVSNAAPSGTTITVTIVFPATTSVTAAPVDDLNLAPYLSAPARGGTPTRYFYAPQYTGNVAWTTPDMTALNGIFEGGATYTATVTLTANSGYTLDGVSGFTHAGAIQGGVSDNAGVVTIRFPDTSNVPVEKVTDLDLAPYLPAPVTAGTPTTYFYAPQYTGNVAWTNSDMMALNGLFDGGTTYTATVTLTANSGYTLDGVSGFTHAGAVQDGVSYNAGVVTISFPATSKAPITAFSGESGEEDSFIDMIGKAKAENRTYQLIVMPFDFSTESVDLSAADRDITGGLSLTTANSPANVTLDGGGRVIQLSSNGSVITVDSGVTLTLRNITFRGKTGNNAPLIKVTAGGKLILEDGAVITENDNTVNTGGGVLVDGGTLVMTGGTISDNTLSSLGSNGGGVRLTNKGTFIMSGGTISGNTAAENGGGVFLYDSSRFTMSGGTISGNTAAGSMGGGGVFLDHSTFTMSGGTISGNIVSSGSNSTMGGGGVFLANSGTFTKKPADGSLSSGVIYGYIDNSPDGNWVGTRKTDGTGTPNTHTAGRGDVVYYNTDGKYRDSTLGDTDTFSLSGPWDN